MQERGEVMKKNEGALEVGLCRGDQRELQFLTRSSGRGNLNDNFSHPSPEHSSSPSQPQLSAS